MRVEKLFHVLVVAGASSTAGGVVACGDDNTGTGTTPSSQGGASAQGGSKSNGGSTSGGGSTSQGGSTTGDTCESKCKPDPQQATWTDCNGCCCWLPAGTTAHAGPTAICGEEPCCAGRGR